MKNSGIDFVFDKKHKIYRTVHEACGIFKNLNKLRQIKSKKHLPNIIIPKTEVEWGYFEGDNFCFHLPYIKAIKKYGYKEAYEIIASRYINRTYGFDCLYVIQMIFELIGGCKISNTEDTKLLAFKMDGFWVLLSSRNGTYDAIKIRKKHRGMEF